MNNLRKAGFGLVSMECLTTVQTIRRFSLHVHKSTFVVITIWISEHLVRQSQKTAKRQETAESTLGWWGTIADHDVSMSG